MLVEEMEKRKKSLISICNIKYVKIILKLESFYLFIRVIL